MCGSGALISGGLRARSGCFGAGTGTTSRPTRRCRPGANRARRAARSTSGSGWRGVQFLRQIKTAKELSRGSAVGGRFGLTARAVENEGEGRDFSWGDGEDLASVESLGDAWNSG